MATSKSTVGSRSRVRPHSSKDSLAPASVSGAGRGSAPSRPNRTAAELTHTLLALEVMRNVALVAAMALERQNAEHDAEIASVLVRSVVDPLSTAIERLRGGKG